MSFTVRVQCAAGCGAFGDADLEFLCVACHGDRAELRQHQELKDFMKKRAVADAEAQTTPAEAVTGNVTGSPSRRAPSSVDHCKALEALLGRPRERNADVVERERDFLQREMAIRNTCVEQLRKYMIASDTDEQVDPKEWERYQYGTPRPVPRHNVDRATEIAAQIRMFCSWRQRTVRRRLEAEQQRREAERKEQRAKSKKMLLHPLVRSPSPPKRQAHDAAAAAAAATVVAATHGQSATTRERKYFTSIWRKKGSKGS